MGQIMYAADINVEDNLLYSLFFDGFHEYKIQGIVPFDVSMLDKSCTSHIGK